MPNDVRVRAWAAAERSALASGIAVREVRELADLAVVRHLFDTLWSAHPANPVATVELLRAYAHTGQYVVVADDLTRPGHPVVAASIGFLAAPAGRALHSHVTGVLAPGRGRSLGYALKLHQRAWALERGLDEITWTFDPLIRRNAWFTLAKLGAVVQEYVVDFYGTMSDRVNAGAASDRLSVTWPLASADVDSAAGGQSLAVDLTRFRAEGADETLTVGASGAPRRSGGDPSGRMALVQVPSDIEAMRAVAPAVGRAWRWAVREVLGGALADGWRVCAVGRDGFYVLVRDDAGDAEAADAR